MVPGKGNNRVVFKLTDRFNNTTTTEVLVTRQNNLTEQPVERPEYDRIISGKQIASFSTMLKNRAKDDLLKVIAETDIENKQFGKIDDYISLLREDAAKHGIKSDEVDKLALRVAVMDNVLTQAAVDYLAKHTTGEINKILTDLDIYKENIMNWTKLQEYVASKSEGRISPDDLNNIAAAVLADTDPSITVLKKKILTFSDKSAYGDLIRQTLAALDQRSFKAREEWLQAFIEEALKHGLTQSQISEILVMISASPGTKVEQYLKDLIDHSEEPLTSALKSIDLKKEGINTPEELLSYLFNNKGKYSEASVNRSIADLVSSKDISGEGLKTKYSGFWKNNLWILWILIGAGILSLFLVFWKRRNEKNSNK